MTFPNTPFQKWLRANKACAEARQWVGKMSYPAAYKKLRTSRHPERQDWLRWFLDTAKCEISIKKNPFIGETTCGIACSICYPSVRFPTNPPKFSMSRKKR